MLNASFPKNDSMGKAPFVKAAYTYINKLFKKNKHGEYHYEYCYSLPSSSKKGCSQNRYDEGKQRTPALAEQ